MYRLDYDDKKKLRDILTKLYGSHNAEKWQMNVQVYQEVVQLVVESGQCSDAMGWVPRPYAGGNPLMYATKQMVKAFLRHFSRDHNAQYLICLKAAAFKYKVAVEAASRGL